MSIKARIHLVSAMCKGRNQQGGLAILCQGRLHTLGVRTPLVTKFSRCKVRPWRPVPSR